MSNLNCNFSSRFAAFIHSVGDSPQYHIRSLIFWGNLECLPWAQKHKRNSDERFYRSDCGTNLGVAISCFATNLKIINNEPTRCLSSDLDQPVQALLYSAIGSTMLPELPMLQVLTNCQSQTTLVLTLLHPLKAVKSSAIRAKSVAISLLATIKAQQVHLPWGHRRLDLKYIDSIELYWPDLRHRLSSNF